MSKELINLLPPQRRNILRRKHFFGRISRALDNVLLGLLLMTFTGVLLASTYYVLGMFNESTMLDEKEEAVQANKALRTAVAEQRLLLEQAVKVGENRLAWSDVIREVIQALPPAQVKEMNAQAEFSDDEISSPRMTIVGRAPTRAALASITSRLQAIPGIKEVKSPTSNILDAVNPSFELVILLEDPKI